MNCQFDRVSGVRRASQKGSEAMVGRDGGAVVPKRVNLYRVNREALDRQTAFGFDRVTLTEAARAVRLIVSPEAVAADVVRKAPTPATTIERLDTALKPIRDGLGCAGEK